MVDTYLFSASPKTFQKTDSFPEALQEFSTCRLLDDMLICRAVSGAVMFTTSASKLNNQKKKKKKCLLVGYGLTQAWLLETYGSSSNRIDQGQTLI